MNIFIFKLYAPVVFLSLLDVSLNWIDNWSKVARSFFSSIISTFTTLRILNLSQDFPRQRHMGEDCIWSDISELGQYWNTIETLIHSINNLHQHLEMMIRTQMEFMVIWGHIALNTWRGRRWPGRRCARAWYESCQVFGQPKFSRLTPGLYWKPTLAATPPAWNVAQPIFLKIANSKATPPAWNAKEMTSQ